MTWGEKSYTIVLKGIRKTDKGSDRRFETLQMQSRVRKTHAQECFLVGM